MRRSLLIIVTPLVALLACGGQAPQETAAEADTAQETTEVTLPSLLADTSQYVGTEIAVRGTVDHVCKHGGKRLFIMGEDPKDRFKVTAGDAVGAFDVVLEGSDLVVKGVVQEQRIDDAYLDNWEAELGAQEKPEAAHEGLHDGEHEDEQQESLRQIANMRTQLAESGKDHLSFYSLECSSYETIQ
jgi:hypothetical protein